MKNKLKTLGECKKGDTLYCVGVDGKASKVKIAEISFYDDDYDLKYTNGCRASGYNYETSTSMGMYACTCYTTKEEAYESYDNKIKELEYYKKEIGRM